MQDESFAPKSDGTVAFLERFAPTTEEKVPATDGTNTQEKSTPFGARDALKAVKEGTITPEEAIKKAEPHFEVSQGRQFKLPTISSRQSHYLQSCAEREVFQLNKQPFVFPGFTKHGDFYLSQGLTLVGGQSGKGKSTLAANILAGFVNFSPTTKALVMSNEENTDAILHRVACVLLKKSYMAFHNLRLSVREENQVREMAMSLLNRIIVCNDSGWDTSCLEDVKTILESSQANEISMVVIDYYQTVSHSREVPDLETFQVLKKFGPFLRAYGRRSPVPIVVFCQLHPKSSAPEFQSRVQNDKTIYNDAFNVVEIEPDFETGLTTFTIHKQRFGVSQGVNVVLKFDSGRYIEERGL